MSNWIDLTSYISEEYIKIPRSITITAPNGVGKTTSVTRFISSLSLLDIFDRIYVVVTSHEISNKVITNLEKFGATRIIHYIGIDKACINKKLLGEVKKLGLNPSFACTQCEYNIFKIYGIKGQEERIKYCSKYVENFFKNNNKVLSPILHRPFDWNVGNLVCIQPLIKYIVVFPQTDTFLKHTTIIVCPYSIFSSKPIVQYFRKFFKRQRAIRKYLAFFDECDNIVYEGFSYKLSYPDFTNFDIEILEEFSTGKTNLKKYVDFYNRLYELLLKIYNDDFDVEEGTKKVIDLIKKYHRIIKKVSDLAFEISLRSFIERKRTFLISSVSEVQSIEYFTESMANSVELSGKDIVVQDVDYAYKVLYDVEYPFRYWWKLSTTATFPQPEIFSESKLTTKVSKIIENVETIDIFPDNVVLFTFVLFPEMFSEYSIESRNELIEEKVDKIVLLIKKSVELYRSITLSRPNGVILFTGNKRQFNVLREVFESIALRVSEGLIEFNYDKTKVLITYCASKYSRGIDLDFYDISIVVAPLIRPPRRETFFDTLDIAKATAEVIQSAFRIVRSISPPRTKLLGFEANILFKKTYIDALPTWFRKLMLALASSNLIYNVKLE